MEMKANAGGTIRFAETSAVGTGYSVYVVILPIGRNLIICLSVKTQWQITNIIEEERPTQGFNDF